MNRQEKVNHQGTKAPRRFSERRAEAGHNIAPQAFDASSSGMLLKGRENACGAGRSVAINAHRLGALAPWWFNRPSGYRGVADFSANFGVPLSQESKVNHQGTKAPRRSSERHATDAVLDTWDVEVDEQAKPPLGKFEIGEKLRLVNGNDFLGRFDFNNDQVVDDHVDAETSVDTDASVDDWRDHLSFNGEAARAQLVSETLLVHGLDETWAESVMNGESRINDFMSNKIMSRSTFHRLGALVPWWFIQSSSYRDVSDLATQVCPPIVATNLEEMGSC